MGAPSGCRAGLGGDAYYALVLGSFRDGPVEHLQISDGVDVDGWPGVCNGLAVVDLLGEVASSRVEELGAIGGGVAVSGGLDDRVGPVPVIWFPS